MPSLKGVVMLPWTALQQVFQIVTGLWSYVREDFRLDTFIPDWLLRITVYAIPAAVLGDTPEEQIEGSIILIGWSIATSLFTGFLTAGFVAFWSVFLFIGLVRFSDWGSAAWNRTTSVSLPGRGSQGRYTTRKRKD